MSTRILFAIPLFLACLSLKAQDSLIRPFLKAWTITDTSQTHRAQVFYDALRNERDTTRYRLVVNTLHTWLDEHPDKRLEARAIIYEALGAREYNFPTESYIPLLQKAMRYAHELADDQLLAEIYCLYAVTASNQPDPQYNLKAIELMRHVGFSHFAYVHNRFFDMSRSLYLTQDYRQSIDYGLACLGLRHTDKEHWDDFVYVFQLDMLGASYKQLGQYDSVLYYYGLLASFLPGRMLEDECFRTLWRSIARGNRGHVLALQGKYEEAIPLLEEYLHSSVICKDPLNVSLAANALADLYERQGAPATALSYWRQALQAALQSNSPANALQSAQAIAQSMRLNGNKDSALMYMERYHEYKDTLAARLGRNRLSAINARMAFDNLQNNLLQSQAALTATRFTRNVILVAIVVAALIALLLYNRHRLKYQLTLQRVQQQKEQAEQEARHAREQIAGFTTHIIEKNNLITALQEQLVGKDQPSPDDEVPPALLQYTLFTDNEWEKFKSEFAKAYPGFLHTLRQRIDQITPAEERLAALIYLQLNTYQIANTLGISKDSVQRSKRRLKKRLDLPDPVTVEEYIYNLLAAK